MVSFFRKITVSLLTFSMLLLSFPAWAQVNFTKLEITAYDLENFSEGKAAFSQITGDPIYTALSPDGAVSFLYGYLDEKGQVVITPKYLYAADFQAGFAPVTAEVSENKNGGQYISNVEYLINAQGEPIPATMTLSQSGLYLNDYRGGLILWLKPNYDNSGIKYGITDTDGNWLFPLEYDELHLPQEGLCLAKESNHYGYLQYGKKSEIIPFIYEEAKDFSCTLAAVKVNGLWGYIDRNGQWQIKPQYLDVQNFSENLAAVKTKNGWGVINQANEMIIPDIFAEIHPCNDGRIAAKLRDKYGYFAANGEKVIDFLYTEATDFHYNTAVVSTSAGSANYQLINLWGEQLLPQQYRRITLADEKSGLVQNQDRSLALFTFDNLAFTEPKSRSFIRLYLNDRYLASDSDPIIRENRTYLPLRTLSSSLNADIAWDSAAKTVTLNADNRQMILTADSPLACINGQVQKIDSPVFIQNGRTMVPLRFIAEFFGLNITWDQEKRAVYMAN